MASTPPVATTYTSPDPRIPSPNRYDGDPLACRGFLNQSYAGATAQKALFSFFFFCCFSQVAYKTSPGPGVTGTDAGQQSATSGNRESAASPEQTLLLLCLFGTSSPELSLEAGKRAHPLKRSQRSFCFRPRWRVRTFS
ncbi:hypothetical protein FKM82_024738 [Ascaphus truei]